MSTFKLAMLENNKEVLEKLYRLENSSIALKLRSIIKTLTGCLSNFEEEKNEYIKRNAPDGQQIKQGTSEYQEAIKYIDQLLNSDIEITWEQLLKESDIQNAKADFSVYDLDILEALGLFKENVTEKEEKLVEVEEVN